MMYERSKRTLGLNKIHTKTCEKINDVLYYSGAFFLKITKPSRTGVNAI